MSTIRDIDERLQKAADSIFTQMERPNCVYKDALTKTAKKYKVNPDALDATYRIALMKCR